MSFLWFRVQALNTNLFTLSAKQFARPFGDQASKCFQTPLQFLFFWPELICLQHIRVTSLRKVTFSLRAKPGINGLTRCCTSTAFWRLPGASALLTIKLEILWQPPLGTGRGMAGPERLSIKSEGKEPALWGCQSLDHFPVESGEIGA